MTVEMNELMKTIKAEKKKVEVKAKQFARCSNSIEYWILKGKLETYDQILGMIEKTNTDK